MVLLGPFLFGGGFYVALIALAVASVRCDPRLRRLLYAIALIALLVQNLVWYHFGLVVEHLTRDYGDLMTRHLDTSEFGPFVWCMVAYPAAILWILTSEFCWLRPAGKKAQPDTANPDT